MKPLAATLNGVIPILATPFHEDESLDLVSWARMIEFFVGLKTNGITILGVLGESNRLNDHERETLIREAVRVVAGRVPIIVGVSHAGTQAACYLAHMAQRHGADAVMLAPTKDPALTEEKIVEVFQHVATAGLPIILQDHPASTDVNMSVPLVARIVQEVAAVVGIKAEAVPTAPKIRALRKALTRPVPILAGLGALYAPFDLDAGIDGFNTGFAFPEVLQGMLDAANANDHARVHTLYARYAALIVFEQQPGLAIRKALLKQRSLLASNRVRHPGASATEGNIAQLNALLSHALPGVDMAKPITP